VDAARCAERRQEKWRAIDALGDSSAGEQRAPGKAVAATRRRPGAAVVLCRAPASSAPDQAVHLRSGLWYVVDTTELGRRLASPRLKESSPANYIRRRGKIVAQTGLGGARGRDRLLTDGEGRRRPATCNEEEEWHCAS
jgi:hypothetical protein